MTIAGWITLGVVMSYIVSMIFPESARFVSGVSVFLLALLFGLLDMLLGSVSRGEKYPGKFW